MSEITIRAAAVEDAPSIARVHVETWQHAYRGQIPDSYLDSLSIERRAEWHSSVLANPAAKSHVLVALDGDQIVGFCMSGTNRDDDADEATGEIYAIYVDPRFMGKGAGSALITASMNRLRDEGFTRTTLWVLATNAQTRGFYEHHGWAADDASKAETVADFELHEVRYTRNLHGES